MISVIAYIQSKTNLSKQEAWWILEHITKQNKEQLLLLDKTHLTEAQNNTIENWINKLTHESIPLSYLLETVPFGNLTIKVTPPILIPRPETEEWVSNVIQTLHPFKKEIKTILDIGTGSGCIALSLAKAFDTAHVTAIDINPQALKLAKQNAKYNELKNISFIESNLFDNIKDQTFDLIVSNPPYIDPAHKDNMSPTVTKWEDHQALFTDNKGLNIIKQILEQAKNNLNISNNLPFQLVLEFDHGQENIIAEYAAQHNWHCKIYKDLFGKNRTAYCKNI